MIDPSLPSQATSPPPELSGHLEDFWQAGEELSFLNAPLDEESPPALERLGPSPFPRSGFPILGFLATVYEHVAAHARQRVGPAT